MRIALIYNPAAGRYSRQRLQPLGAVLARKGHVISWHESFGFRHDVDAPDADCLCIIGGDGTARTILTNIDRAGDLVGCVIVPSGTINLAARELDYRADWRAIASLLEDGRRSPTDVRLGVVNNARFLVCASIGADGMAVENVRLSLKRRFGRIAYIISFLMLLFRWKRPRLHVVVDGTGYQAEAIFVLKGRYYAGPWSLDSAASLRHASFRVLLMPNARRRDYLRLAVYAMLGRRWRDPSWKFLSAASVTVQADEAWPVQADGDVVTYTPAQFSVSPEGVRFL